MLKKKSKFSKEAWYSCAAWPNCDIVCKKFRGQYEFTDQELRALRMKGHRMAEEIWGEWRYANKKAMYKWLKENSETGHFSTMNKRQCRETIDKLYIKTFEHHE